MTLRIALLLAFCAAICAPARAAIDAAAYSQSQSLSNDMKIYWKVDGSTMRLALEATATGWVGFGLAEMGRMPGADIVYYEAASNTLTDAYSLSFAAPIKDSCQSWALLSAEVEGGKIRVEMSRPLTNEDPSDRNFIDDAAWPLEPTKVIAAWGDTATMSYHGTSKRVQSTVRFFGAAAPVDPIASLNANVASSDYTSFLIKPSTSSNTGSSFAIPVQETTYMEFEFPVQGAMGASDDTVAVHMVAAEAVVTPGNEAYVHHFVLDGCSSADCSGTCNKLWAWAPGAPSYALPSTVGFKLMGSGFKCLKIQTHYDNAALKGSLTDDSGIRIYATKVGVALRSQDAGMVVFGDENVVDGLTLPSGKSSTEFQSGTCTSLFADSAVTVFNEGLHMHNKGQVMVATVERGGQVVRSSRVEYYDFDAAGVYTNPSVGAGYTLQKGDVYKVKCFFDTQQSGGVIFGLGSADEMCMSFVSYYPAQAGLTPGACSPQKSKADNAVTGAQFVGGTFASIASLSGFGRFFADQTATFTCPPLPTPAPTTTGSPAGGGAGGAVAPVTTTPPPEAVSGAPRAQGGVWLTAAGAFLAALLVLR